MSGSVNKVIIVGNLGRDPEIRHTQSGMKISNMSIATTETWRDKQSGEKKERTEWHKVACMDERLSDVAEKYLKKGSKVYLEGSLQTRKWTGNDGVEKYTTEVVLQRFSGVLTMLDSPRRQESASSRDDEYQPTQDDMRKEAQELAREYSEALDDEIPF